MGHSCRRFLIEMRLFLSVFLFGAVAWARPGPKDKDDYMFLISSCLTEQWDEEVAMDVNMKNTMDCLGCFEKIPDVMTETGLADAKACVRDYLPEENQACSTQLNGLVAGQEDTGEPVVDCFEEWVANAAAEYCIDRSTSTEPIDVLTDGSMCMLEGLKNVTMFAHYVHDMENSRSGKKIRGNKMKGKRGNPMKKYVMHELLPLAMCQAANNGDDARIGECKQCFATVTKENHETKAKECSKDFLMPYFQDCEGMMDSMTKSSTKEEKKQLKKCLGRGVIKSIVETCNPGTPVANPTSLLETMECGHEFTIDWVEKNARPEFAKRIVQFLSDDDDEDDDDDDFVA